MKYTFTLISIICTLFVSCVGKDEQCDHIKSLPINFVYYGDSANDILKEKVKGIDAFIYDTNHKLVRHVKLNHNEAKFPQTTVTLNKGAYKVVTIGNLHHKAHLEGTAIGSDLSQLSFIQASLYNPTHTPLYYGEREINIQANQVKPLLVELNSLHFRLKINIIGYKEMNYKPEDLTLVINDFPTGYVVEQNFINIYTNYQSVLTEATINQYLQTDVLNIMKSELQAPLEIELLHKNDRITRFYLYDVINKSSQIDLSKQEVDIPLDIIIKPLSVYLQIQSWVIEDADAQFN